MLSVKFYKNAMLLLCATLLLIACSSPRQATIDYDKAVNFTDYQRFAFYQPSAPVSSANSDNTQTNSPSVNYDPLITQHIKAAIRREMTALGYQYDETAPQLLVNYQMNTEVREDVRSSPFRINADYSLIGRNSAFNFGFPLVGGIETHRYQVGTILIDVIDANANRLIWQGLLEGKLNQQQSKQPQAQIDAAVTTIFKRYPTRLATQSTN